MKDKMTSALSYVFMTLVLIIATPFLLLWLVLEIIYSPLRYYKVKKSLYYKDFPYKYEWLDSTHCDNEAYTIVKNNDLPINYFKFGEKYDWRGTFLFKDVILDFSQPFLYDDESDCWCVYPDDEDTEETETNYLDSCLTVEGWKKSRIESFQNSAPDHPCNQIVFFYNINRTKRFYGENALNKLTEDNDFILYEKGNLEEAIIKYITDRMA